MPARSAELTIGRTIGVTFDDGDDFFTELRSVCATHGIKYGYIPVFVGAFRHVEVAGTCVDADPEAPMFHSHVDLHHVETVGAGTLAWDPDNETLLPHVHLSVGRRMQSADGLTSHLFDAEVQFLLEMVVVEVLAPEMTRPINSDLFDLALLSFGS